MRHVRKLRGAHLLRSTLGDQIFLFGSHEVWAVEREKGLAFLDELPDVIDVTLIDVPVDLHMNMRKLRLIAGELTSCAYGAYQRLALDSRSPYTDQLLLVGRDFDSASRHRRCGCRTTLRSVVLRVLRHEVHSIRCFSGFVVMVLGAHGVIPIENLAFASRGGRLRSRP